MQEASKLTPDVFILPMDIKIITAGGEKNEKIQIKTRTEKFSIKVDGEPTSVVFDKDEKIPLKLIKMNSLKSVHDEN